MPVAALVFSVASIVALAAHFLRLSTWSGLFLSLAMLFFMVVRQPWARRLLQLWLTVATLIWIELAVRLYRERLAAGVEASRLLAILGIVAGVALVSALLLEGRKAREHFKPPPD